jgi:signal transduction histidine kinase
MADDEAVRLRRELADALEQQAATSEILRVMSRSPGDAQPVFETIVTSAARLCDAHLAFVMLHADGHLRLAARTGCTPAFAEYLDGGSVRGFPVRSETPTGRAVLTRAPVQVSDFLREPGMRSTPAHEREGVRTVLAVPMLRDDRLLGVVTMWRREVRPFSQRQISLVQTFAQQAVIAIENVRLFTALEDKSRQLEVASRHKSAFLANMSHELRTPLNAIIGFTRIVMRHAKEALEARQYENLEKILVSAQDLLSLINAILDLAKVEAGRMEVHPGEAPLAAVLEQCMRTIEPLLEEDVALVKAFGADLPVMTVDEEKLRRIVMNLLSNAAKYTSSGHIDVRARSADGAIELAVADTGIGIPVEKLESIFEEFEQADARHTREYGGTGLGLAIARRLARLMGGEIRAESVLGAGSTFTLTLPVRYPPAPSSP